MLTNLLLGGILIMLIGINLQLSTIMREIQVWRRAWGETPLGATDLSAKRIEEAIGSLHRSYLKGERFE